MEIPELYKDVKFMDVDQKIREAAESQFKQGLGIYLWGEVGVGKTHIAYAIAKQLKKLGINFNFEKVAPLMDRLRKYDEDEYLDKLKTDLGVLFLDDLGVEKTSDWVREKLITLLDYRAEHKLPVFITSNCDIKKTLAENVGGRLSSRIAGMTIVFEKGGGDKRIEK